MVATGVAKQPQRFLQLRPAVAFEAAEHVAGEAFAVEPDERRLAAERADDQRHMVLAAGGIAKRDHLARREIVERQSGAGNDFGAHRRVERARVE